MSIDIYSAIRDYFAVQLGGSPPDGWFVLWTKSDGIYSFHTSDIDSLAKKIVDIQSRADVYVGMALQKEKPQPGKRGVGNTTAAIMGVWIEIDCKEGVHKENQNNLPTKNEALEIINKYELRPTLIIDSGGGFHCHWWLDSPFLFHTDDERQRGQMLVQNFQYSVASKFRERGFKVDTTSDLARVLRPPFTYNHKSGYPVQVALIHYDVTSRYSVGTLESHCAPPLTHPVLAPGAPSVSTPTALQGADPSVSFPPVEFSAIMAGCAWLRHCRDDAACLPEPEWFAALSIVARCVDGNCHCHELSSPYPGYSHAETEMKITHALQGGPRTCLYISTSLNAAQYCSTCNHIHNSSSPISLGFVKSKVSSSIGLNLTDSGNAEVFAKTNSQDVRYIWTWNSWYIYDGNKWRPDNCGLIIQLAIDTLRNLAIQAKKKLPKNDAIAVASHALTSESASGLKNMLSIAKSSPALATLPEMFDSDLWLFNVQNGTLELKSMAFKSHEREDLITKVAGVSYDPSATCPLWEMFLYKIMNGNENLISFLRRFAGLSLTGSMSEQCLILLYGTGANGKSVFLELLRYVLGDYAMQSDFTTFTASKSQNVRNDLARLVGARFVTAVESEYGQPLAEAAIKQVTGGDAIIARFLFKEFFQFYPQFKLWLASNHKPVVKGGDHGIWRRIKLVPFAVTIPPAEQDPMLTLKLREEGSGILNWMLRGCREWLEQGLNPPPEVAAAVADYRGEMDMLAEFIAEQCVVGAGEKVKAKVLYKAYRDYCEAEGELTLGKKRFSDMLLQRGFRKDKSGDIVWHGLGLRAKASTPAVTPPNPFGVAPSAGWAQPVTVTS